MVGHQEAFILAMLILVIVGSASRDKIVEWFRRQ